jgi:pyruvate dehydrogenase E1 component beta subunit
MKIMNMVNAINDALDIKLAEDKSVIVYGEDVGVEGGVFRVTEGLQKKYGAERVFDSPLAESGIVGTAVGMAVAGLKPVVEMQFCGFIYPAFNQIISHATRMRNRSRGLLETPIVIRLPYGGGINALEHHSESMEAIFGHIPGLKVVVPSTPHDAKGMLIAAIESKDTILFMEPKRIYRAIKQEVADGKYTIPLGKANVLTQGKDVTVYPIDRETIAKSVKKTGRIITVTEGPRTYGVGSEISQIALEEAFLHLEAPPARVSGYDVIVPLPKGEHHYMQDAYKIFYEIEKTVKY